MFGALAALAAGIAACGAHADDSAGTAAQDFRLPNINMLGTISAGETKTDCDYTPPARDAWAFTANAGDQLTIGVRSNDGGDAVAYLTTAQYEVLAYNDDARPGTKDAQITYTVPAGSGTVELRIVFEDYNHVAGSFDVSLDGSSAPTCDPGEDGLDYYGTPEQCEVMHYQCPGDEVPFSNECGCGCETLANAGRR